MLLNVRVYIAKDGDMPLVLIVDDDLTMVSLLGTLLELDGYDVVEASTRRDLVTKLTEAEPDLVIMDVYLKDADGIELLRELRGREQPGLDQIPVVMTSGMELSSKCLDAGANAFLLKPYDPEQLLEVVKQQLGGA